MEQLSKKRMDELIAHLVTKRIDDMRDILEKNGVPTKSFNDKEVQIAFLKAIKDSNASFRNQVSNLMASLVQGKNFVQQPLVGFAKQPLMQDFVEQPQLAFTEPVDDLNPYSTTQVTKDSVGSSTAKSSGSFWSNLGSLASKDNLQSLFNTGLNVASTSLQNKANKESEERALELERLRLQQIQAQADLSKKGGAGVGTGGLSTGAWVAIGLSAALVVTVIVVAVVKKKK